MAGRDSAINGTLSLDGYRVCTSDTHKQSMETYGRSNVLVLSHKTRRSLILATNSKIELGEWIERLRVAVTASSFTGNCMMFEEVASLDRFKRHDIDSSTASDVKENVRPLNSMPLAEATSRCSKQNQPQLSFLTATLPKEVVKLHIKLSYFDPSDQLDLDSLRGQLLITNYMVCFIPDHKTTLTSSSKFFELPLGTFEFVVLETHIYNSQIIKQARLNEWRRLRWRRVRVRDTSK